MFFYISKNAVMKNTNMLMKAVSILNMTLASTAPVQTPSSDVNLLDVKQKIYPAADLFASLENVALHFALVSITDIYYRYYLTSHKNMTSLVIRNMLVLRLGF